MAVRQLESSRPVVSPSQLERVEALLLAIANGQVDDEIQQ